MPKEKAKKRGAKEKAKKRGVGGGSAGGGFTSGSGTSNVNILGNIAGSSGLDLEVIGHGLEDLSFMDPDEDVVEVVYIEPSLKRTEWVPSGAPISRDWLRRCVTNSHGAWRDRLPNIVQPAHLTGRVIPKIAQSVSDVAIGKGLVVVELGKAHMN